jgi:hypothetical protein
VNEDGFTYYSSVAAAPAKGAKAKKEKVAAEAPKKESSVDTSAIELAVLGFIDKNGHITNTAEYCES